jgi:pimeloyl-ACP methyl ester carboxylesterase
LVKGEGMAAWKDGYWWSNDGLRLHYRDYAGPAERPPIICIPGLTRNARDFESVAGRLAGEWRVIAVDLRGRGESAFAKDAMTYVPLTYLQDLEALFRELALERFILFGTSLGGLLTMLLSQGHKVHIAAALINDIGPVLERPGLDRIKAYVGKSQSWPTWMHAARHYADAQAGTYPRWDLEQWLAHAKRVCRLNSNGRIVQDYDMRIAEPFKLPGGATGFDPWMAFRGLADVPLLIVRGALSDLFSEGTAAQMAAEMPKAEVVTVPDVGHPPVLDEPEATAAIDRLLAKVR